MINHMLFNFSSGASLDHWRVVNDGVMGGLSQGEFSINEEGNGFFQGKISLDNNGGFSSVRYNFETLKVSKYTAVQIRLKGDGKAYQFRLKETQSQRHSYISTIETSGDWQIVTIQFSDMYPAFRGRTLDISNYEGQELSEIAFLIGNKRKENFALEIDYIKLQ